MRLMNFKKEVHGRKFNFGGEYPHNPKMIFKIKNVMNRNGYDVYFQHRKENNSVIIWWDKRRK